MRIRELRGFTLTTLTGLAATASISKSTLSEVVPVFVELEVAVPRLMPAFR